MPGEHLEFLKNFVTYSAEFRRNVRAYLNFTAILEENEKFADDDKIKSRGIFYKMLERGLEGPKICKHVQKEGFLRLLSEKCVDKT